MEKGMAYTFTEFIDDDQVKIDIVTYFDNILKIVKEEGPTWVKFKTRSGIRFINEIQFEENLVVPSCFVSIHDEITVLVTELVRLAYFTITDGSDIIPLQLYLCYYRNGNDICPMHSHKCRQITLSIGSDRIMTVNSRKVNLYNGSVIFLHGEKHGILKDIVSMESGLTELGFEENRLSLNLFYTTSTEMQGI